MVDVVIIGGGASGIASAIELKKNNKELKVLVLEQNDKILKKLLKTGNGKCNISNNLIKQDKYNDFRLIENNQTEVDIEKFFLDEGLVLKTLDENRMYPYSENSGSVVNILLESIKKYNIDIKTNYCVLSIDKKDDFFIINNEIKSKYVIVSTGSNSQEKTNGYDILKRLGHSVSKLVPGLVNLQTKEDTKAMRGLRIKCKTLINGVNYVGELLFKENGISGIISFDISRVLKNGDVVYFDIAPEFSKMDLHKLFENRNIETVLMGLFPKMIYLDIIKRRGEDVNLIIDEIKNYKFTITGRGSFETSQITIGGVETNNIKDSFESNIVSNLYVTGEVLNVDGASGGFNLYFAWLSGIIAARSILNNSK